MSSQRNNHNVHHMHTHTHTTREDDSFWESVSVVSLKVVTPDLSSMGFFKTAGKGSLRMELFANCVFELP